MSHSIKLILLLLMVALGATGCNRAYYRDVPYSSGHLHGHDHYPRMSMYLGGYFSDYEPDPYRLHSHSFQRHVPYYRIDPYRQGGEKSKHHHRPHADPNHKKRGDNERKSRHRRDADVQKKRHSKTRHQNQRKDRKTSRFQQLHTRGPESGHARRSKQSKNERRTTEHSRTPRQRRADSHQKPGNLTHKKRKLRPQSSGQRTKVHREGRNHALSSDHNQQQVLRQKLR